MTISEQFILELKQQKLEKGDVIFVLQGDGLNRAQYATELFKNGYAPLVAMVGSANDKSYGSFPSSEVRDEMVRLGVSLDHIYFEDTQGGNTREEAERIVTLAREKNWCTILIVTSPHHQFRSFLTLIKTMSDLKVSIRIINVPANLSMTEDTPWGKRIDLLDGEYARIKEYQQKGDVASFEEGIKYLQSII